MAMKPANQEKKNEKIINSERSPQNVCHVWLANQATRSECFAHFAKVMPSGASAPQPHPRRTTMTPEQFKDARKALCYSQQALADEWGMGGNGGRTIRRWE
jgi:hypothetical protein